MSARKGIRILSICDDDGIRFSRELVLLQEGYEVLSVTSNACLVEATFDAAIVRSFHIAILCHSIHAERAVQIAEKLRRLNPAIRVARVHAIRSRSDHFYDADCEVLPGPGPLLAAIATMSSQSGASQQEERKRA